VAKATNTYDQEPKRKEVHRMQINWLRVVVLSVFLTLAVPSIASAHVRVLPEEVPAGSFEVFTIRVPTEKDIPTTGVRVEVPEGFTISRVEPVPGWNYELEEDGVVSAITWSGGEIGETEFQQFDIQGQTPEESGEYSWRAFQTYEDGSVVEWIGSEDSEEPASVVSVTEGGTNDSAVQQSGSEAASGVGLITQIAAYGGLVLGTLALVIAMVALLRGNK
jgi:uncharacterized protein YcnI